MFKVNWQSGEAGHPALHNAIGRVINFRYYVRDGSLQQMVNDAITNKRPVELEPGKTYDLSAPLVISNTRRVIVNGNGAVIRATADMNCLLDMNGIADCRLEDFDLMTAENVVVQDMARLRWDGTVARSTARNIFRQIHVGGRYVNGWRVGEPGSNLQCDTTLFEGCSLSGGWTPGEATLWQRGLIVGSGVVANNMLHTFSACTTYHHRVHYEITSCQYVNLVNGCNGSYSEIDILHNSPQPVNLDGYRSENGACLLEANVGGATFPMRVSIRNSGFHPGSGGATMGANRAVIRVNYGGYLELRNLTATPLPEGTVMVSGAGLQRPLSIDAYGVSMMGHPVQRYAVDNVTVQEFGAIEVDASGGMVL